MEVAKNLIEAGIDIEIVLNKFHNNFLIPKYRQLV